MRRPAPRRPPRTRPGAPPDYRSLPDPELRNVFPKEICPMKSPVRRGGRASLACLLLLAASAAPAPRVGAADKLKPEEIVAKHLEAVAPQVTRESVKSRVISGTVLANFIAPTKAQVPGRAVLFSRGENFALGMAFDGVPNYPHDRFGFDGEDVS